MGDGHEHPGAMSAGGRHKRPLLLAFALTAAYMLVEATVAVATGSLALLSDAGHMLTDVVGLGLALAAIQVGQSRRSPSQTYGLYRLEVLAALVNAVLLFAIAGYVLLEAYHRFGDPTDVPGAPMLVVAAVGLAVNLVSFSLLRAGAKESLNLRGAFLEVISDALGSAGVLVAALVILTTGWGYADPIIGVAIGLFILPRAWRLGRGALRILLEVAPPEIDVQDMERRLRAVPGVADVHDLHVWTLTSGLEAASGHLRLRQDASSTEVLRAASHLLRDDFGIAHATLQCEPPDFREAPREV